MKIVLKFEPHDCIPPKLVDQLQRACLAAVKNFGVVATSTYDQTEAMEVYDRYFAWQERLNGGDGTE